MLEHSQDQYSRVIDFHQVGKSDEAGMKSLIDQLPSRAELLGGVSLYNLPEAALHYFRSHYERNREDTSPVNDTQTSFHRDDPFIETTLVFRLILIQF